MPVRLFFKFSTADMQAHDVMLCSSSRRGPTGHGGWADSDNCTLAVVFFFLEKCYQTNLFSETPPRVQLLTLGLMAAATIIKISVGRRRRQRAQKVSVG
jgi:hypothetical protein